MKEPSISSLHAPVAKVLMMMASSTPSTTQQPTKPAALPIQLKMKSLWGVGDAVVAAAEEAIAEDAARADGDLAPLLLVDNVLPDRLAGRQPVSLLGR